MAKSVKPFLDEDGKLRQLPSKHAARQLAYEYLMGKFEAGRSYTEKEVNALLSAWHSFGDYFLLRRGLVDDGWLSRMDDGSKYWVNERRPE